MTETADQLSTAPTSSSYRTAGRDVPGTAGVGRSSMSANAIERASSTTSEPRPGIEDIVREHSGAMYRVALSVVRDHALAEDVVQESVVKAW